MKLQDLINRYEREKESIDQAQHKEMLGTSVISYEEVIKDLKRILDYEKAFPREIPGNPKPIITSTPLDKGSFVDIYQNSQYFVGIDTNDDNNSDVMSYSLVRNFRDINEMLLHTSVKLGEPEKVVKFYRDVDLLLELFNAQLLKKKKNQIFDSKP